MLMALALWMTMAASLCFGWLVQRPDIVELVRPARAYARGAERLPPRRIAAADVRLIDGDTISFEGRNYRLMGYDAPETYQAKCLDERYLGQQATNALGRIMAEAQVIELEPKGNDKYGRTLAILYVDGIDIARRMIREEHGVPYNGKTKRQDWCR